MNGIEERYIIKNIIIMEEKNKTNSLPDEQLNEVSGGIYESGLKDLLNKSAMEHGRK